MRFFLRNAAIDDLAANEGTPTLARAFPLKRSSSRKRRRADAALEAPKRAALCRRNRSVSDARNDRRRRRSSRVQHALPELSLGKTGDNRLGPSLHNIVGAKAGQAKGFANYSGGLTDDITWDEATLDKFIADPKSIASNTTMTPFAGIADAEQRKLIIDYLKTQNKAS